MFLPLHGAHQAHNAAVALAAVEAFFGVGAAAARTARRRHRARGLRRGHLAGPAGGRAPQPRPWCWTPRTTRRAPRGHRRGGRRGVRLHPAGRRGRARAATRTSAGCWRPSSRSSPRSWSPRTPPTARWTSTSWPRIAVEVFGEDRVQVEPRLDDALEAAITLAEEEGEYAGAGVLVTGSVDHGRRGPAAAGPEGELDARDADALCVEHADRRVLRDRLRRPGRDEGPATCRPARSGRSAASPWCCACCCAACSTRPGAVCGSAGRCRSR